MELGGPGSPGSPGRPIPELGSPIPWDENVAFKKQLYLDGQSFQLWVYEVLPQARDWPGPDSPIEVGAFRLYVRELPTETVGLSLPSFLMKHYRAGLAIRQGQPC